MRFFFLFCCFFFFISMAFHTRFRLVARKTIVSAAAGDPSHCSAASRSALLLSSSLFHHWTSSVIHPALSTILFGRTCSSSSSSLGIAHQKEVVVEKPPSWRNLPPTGEDFVEEVELGNNVIRFETGKIARFASGAVLLGVKDTNVLSTVVSQQATGGQDFLPLTVDYREKQYAQGKIPNSFMRREGAPAERELLVGRVIDRSIRPLFPKGFYDDVQVTSNVLSCDGYQDPDIMAANATSAALTISDIPWNGPVGVVRIGRVNGKLIVNPDMDELSLSDLNLIYTCTSDKTIMIETQAREISNNDLKTALHLAHKEGMKLIKPQLRLAKKVRNQKKQFKLYPIPDRTMKRVEALAGTAIESVVADPTYGKIERGKALNDITGNVKQILEEEGDEESLKVAPRAVDLVRKKVIRNQIFEKGIRVDGRSLSEVRPLFCEAGAFPALHGSAIFSRGNTQVICTVTLGAPSDAQRLVSLFVSPTKRFMLHYSFPPFSINEVGRLGGLNRREVGHGTLAEKALLALLPPEHEFPYTVSVNSEVMASDGSTSMATVCGGSLALMDAGIALREHVAGVSMGLVTEADSSTGEVKDYRILTDILGLEDHSGDMDFKIAGTRKGVTSIQLDIKLAGVPLDILCECLEPALVARSHIIDHMETVIKCPREEAKQNAPRIVSIKVSPDGLSRLIGPNGSHIKKLQDETGSRVTVNYDGTVTIVARDQALLERTVEKVDSLIGHEIEVGRIYNGVVTAIKDFGAFVQFYGGQEGLLHISELSHDPVSCVSDVVTVGQQVGLKCIDRDMRGNMKFSLKATLPERKQESSNKKVENDFDPTFTNASLPKSSERQIDVDLMYSSPSVIVRSAKECDSAIQNSKKNGQINVTEGAKESSSKRPVTAKEKSSKSNVRAGKSKERLSRKVEVISVHGINDQDSLDGDNGLQVEVKKDSPNNNNSVLVGENCTAFVNQIRAYGLVLQLNDGVKGMLRFEAGAANTFKVGEELHVRCTGLSSKGIPIFTLADH